jgi:hypothetical protein
MCDIKCGTYARCGIVYMDVDTSTPPSYIRGIRNRGGGGTKCAVKYSWCVFPAYVVVINLEAMLRVIMAEGFSFV